MRDKELIVVSEQMSDKPGVETLLDVIRQQEVKVYFGWYLHGELEDKVGFDIASMLVNPSDPRFVMDYVEPLNKDYYYLKDGIYSVAVIGIDEPCIGYFWEGPLYHQNGLICLASDKQANDDARAKYEQKAQHL